MSAVKETFDRGKFAHQWSKTSKSVEIRITLYNKLYALIFTHQLSHRTLYPDIKQADTADITWCVHAFSFQHCLPDVSQVYFYI